MQHDEHEVVVCVEAGRESNSDEDLPCGHDVVGFDLDTRCSERFGRLVMQDPLREDEDWREEEETGEGEEGEDTQFSESAEEFRE